MFTCTFGWALAYAFATGRRTASTQTVMEPDGPLARAVAPERAAPLVDAPTSATPATATAGRSVNHRLRFMCAPSSFAWRTCVRSSICRGRAARLDEVRQR